MLLLPPQHIFLHIIACLRHYFSASNNKGYFICVEYSHTAYKHMQNYISRRPGYFARTLMALIHGDPRNPMATSMSQSNIGRDNDPDLGTDHSNSEPRAQHATVVTVIISAILLSIPTTLHVGDFGAHAPIWHFEVSHRRNAKIVLLSKREHKQYVYCSREMLWTETVALQVCSRARHYLGVLIPTEVRLQKQRRICVYSPGWIQVGEWMLQWCDGCWFDHLFPHAFKHYS